MGELNTLPLHWKGGLTKKSIIPLRCSVYLKIWHRVLYVAGLREQNQRPYSLRVGAGARLNGK